MYVPRAGYGSSKNFQKHSLPMLKQTKSNQDGNFITTDSSVNNTYSTLRMVKDLGNNELL